MPPGVIATVLSRAPPNCVTIDESCSSPASVAEEETTADRSESTLTTAAGVATWIASSSCCFRCFTSCRRNVLVLSADVAPGGLRSGTLAATAVVLSGRRSVVSGTAEQTKAIMRTKPNRSLALSTRLLASQLQHPYGLLALPLRLKFCLLLVEVLPSQLLHLLLLRLLLLLVVDYHDPPREKGLP